MFRSRPHGQSSCQGRDWKQHGEMEELDLTAHKIWTRPDGYVSTESDTIMLDGYDSVFLACFFCFCQTKKNHIFGSVGTATATACGKNSTRHGWRLGWDGIWPFGTVFLFCVFGNTTLGGGGVAGEASGDGTNQMETKGVIYAWVGRRCGLLFFLFANTNEEMRKGVMESKGASSRSRETRNGKETCCAGCSFSRFLFLLFLSVNAPSTRLVHVLRGGERRKKRGVFSVVCVCLLCVCRSYAMLRGSFLFEEVNWMKLLTTTTTIASTTATITDVLSVSICLFEWASDSGSLYVSYDWSR